MIISSDISKSNIINILQHRDGLSYADAVDVVTDVQIQIDNLIETDGDLWKIEDIIHDELDLEPDYIDAFVGF